MYSIILPLKIKDGTHSWELFQKVGLQSFEKFLRCEHLHSFYIVCPLEEISAINTKIEGSRLPFKILAEEDFLSQTIEEKPGWLKQQLIKLCLAKFVSTSYYLVLDGDHYLTRSFGYRDIFHNGQIKYSSEPWQTKNNEDYSTNSRWWTNSSQILNYPVERLFLQEHLMGVTPQVFVTKYVNELIFELESLNSNWQFFLCEKEFTEFTLYWIFLLIKHYDDLYTWQGFPLWKHDFQTNVLRYGQNSNPIRNSFYYQSSYFSVIQGYLKQDITPFIDEFSRNMALLNLLPKNVFLMSQIRADDLDVDNAQVIVGVTSIIRISNSEIPTVFSPQERLIQTVDHLKTLRQKMPYAKIIVLEASQILNLEEIKTLSLWCNYLIIYHNPESFICHLGSNKGLGELYVLHHLSTLIRDKNFHVFCKSVGRYSLDEKFDPKVILTSDLPIFTSIAGSGRKGQCVQTVFYSIPKKFYNHYAEHLKIWTDPDINEPAEHIMTMYVDSIRQYKNVDKIYVNGYGAAHGLFLQL